MTEQDAVLNLASDIHENIRAAVKTRGATDPDVIIRALAAATAMVVSYSSAQRYLEELATAVDAKEKVRLMMAGDQK